MKQLRCLVCSRPLTRSASTAAAIGAACLRKLSGARVKRRAQAVEQPRREVDARQVDWVEVAA